MKTFASRYEGETGKKKKLSRRSERNDDSYVRRMVSRYSDEDSDEMIADNHSRISRKHADETGRSIFRSIQGRFGIHAKMDISQPDDPAELQADQWADSFMRGDSESSQQILSHSPGDISRMSEGRSNETTDEFDSQLQSSKGGGHKLDDDTRLELEAHTGTDLSGVNIHIGPEADHLNNQVKSLAFAHGNDIYFKEGEYNPQSEDGRELIAHEVAHVVQEGFGIHSRVLRQPDPKEKKKKSNPVFVYQISYTKSLDLEQTMILLFKTMYGTDDAGATKLVEYVRVDRGSLNNFWEDKTLSGVQYIGQGEPQTSKYGIHESTYYELKSVLTGEKYEWDSVSSEEEETEKAERINKYKYGTLEEKKTYTDLVKEVDAEFRKLTGFTGMLDPNNPKHADYIKQWNDLMDAKLKETSFLAGDYGDMPVHAQEFLNKHNSQINPDTFADYQYVANLIARLSPEEWAEYQKNATGTFDMFEFRMSMENYVDRIGARNALVADLDALGNAAPTHYTPDPVNFQRSQSALGKLHKDVFLMNEEEYALVILGITTSWAVDPKKKSWIPYLSLKWFTDDARAAFMLKRQATLGNQLLSEKMKSKPHLDEAAAKSELESEAVTDALALMTDDDRKVYEKVKVLNRKYEEAFDYLILNDPTTLVNAMSLNDNNALDIALSTTPPGKEIPALQAEIKKIRPAYRLLYHPITGNRIDEVTDSDEKEEANSYESMVKADLLLLEDPTYRGQLREMFLKRYSIYKVLDTEMDYPFFMGTWHDREALTESGDTVRDKKTGEAIYATTPRLFVTTYNISGDVPGHYDSLEGVRSRQLGDQYKKAKGGFESISRAYMLNEDPGYAERLGFWGKFWESLGEATFWDDVKTDDDFIQNFVMVMTEEGMPLTEAQKARLDSTFAEKAGALIGGLIPVMLEMAISAIMLNPIGEALAATRAMRIIRVVLMRRYGKMGEFAYKAFTLSSKNAAIFGMVDAGAIRGAAFGTSMAVTDMFNPFRVFLAGAKWAKFASLFYNLLAGTVSQMAATYASDYVQYLVDSEFDTNKAFEDTFGRTYDDAKDKLLLTAIMCALFSGAANQTLLLNLKSAIQKMPKDYWLPKDVTKVLSIIAERLALVKQKITGVKSKYGQLLSEIGEVLDNGNVKGKYSGREFNPDKSGGSILSLDWQTVKINQQGIETIKKHLARLSPDPWNDGMLNRLNDIVLGKFPPTEFDLRYYSHELREFERCGTMKYSEDYKLTYDEWNDVHSATLEDYKVNEIIVSGDKKISSLYHPDVQK